MVPESFRNDLVTSRKDHPEDLLDLLNELKFTLKVYTETTLQVEALYQIDRIASYNASPSSRST